MHKAFRVHILNEKGKAAATELAAAFDRLLSEIDPYMPEGRERSLVITQLELASFYAKKAMAQQESNQADAATTIVDRPSGAALPSGINDPPFRSAFQNPAPLSTSTRPAPTPDGGNTEAAAADAGNTEAEEGEEQPPVVAKVAADFGGSARKRPAPAAEKAPEKPLGRDFSRG